MRCIGIIRILIIIFTLLTTWYFAETFFGSKLEIKSLRSLLDSKPDAISQKKKARFHCGNEKACPQDYFAFKIISGAANVVGPSLCMNNKVIMSSVRNNIGRGLNVALINATTGEVIKTAYFDMYSGEVKELTDFLKTMKDGTLVFIASYDDPATKLNDEARDLFTSYGSSFAKKLGFRDSWVFVGGRGLKNKSPFEQHLSNNKETNKYDGWPEALEIEGCIPKKLE